MMKTIKGTTAAGKTTKLIEMLNELEGSTLLVQDEMTPYNLVKMGYTDHLFVSDGSMSFIEKALTDEYDNIGVDLMSLTPEQRKTTLEVIQKLSETTNTNIIVTEQVEYKGEKYLEVV